MLKLKQVSLEKTAYQPDQLILGGRNQVAFAGRSNVGKSSLLNRLFSRKKLAKVSQTPGKTQSINYFLVNGNCYFVDLPGYGYAKAPQSERQRWQRLVDYYFQNCDSLKGMVHLIDIRHDPTELDHRLNEWTAELVERHLCVLTKADKLSRHKQMQAVGNLQKQFNIERKSIITFSAETGDGKSEILAWIETLLR
ncbi:MAG: YihA family ribosome biogenesis GTP-binding protein [candidate division Zixibacteria bacterium]|nr:YihA family ribosome biogenesis GTP-binding protein [candidate division Zixibacteria bacterium]